MWKEDPVQVQKKKISDGNIPVSVKLSDLILDESGYTIDLISNQETNG